MSASVETMTEAKDHRTPREIKADRKRKRDEAAAPTDKSPKKAKKQRHAVANDVATDKGALVEQPDSQPLEPLAHQTQSQKSIATANADETPFYVQTTSLYLPLSPISQAKPLEGLCAEHLSPQLLSYYSPLKAVLLAYSNARLSNVPENAAAHDEKEVYAQSIDEYAVSYVWLTADFLLFKPQSGTLMEGYITVQNENAISLLCYNQFNASIRRDNMPQSWRWRPSAAGQSGSSEQGQAEDTEGAFLDKKGKPVDGLVQFRVLDFEGTGSAVGNKAEGYLLIDGQVVEESVEGPPAPNGVIVNGGSQKTKKKKKSKGS